MKRLWFLGVLFLLFPLWAEEESAQPQAAEVPVSAEEAPPVPVTAEEVPPAREEAQAAAPQKKSIGLEYPETALIETYRREYSSPFGVKWITEALASGSVYRAYVQKKIAEKNMPPCMEFLPLIESAYRSDARSKSGAAGLWQFMENSVTPFLEKNQWIDERMDPWKSTDAALAKLEENYKRFGDWFLALAAYNAGSGALNRFLSRSKEKTYWALAAKGILKEETIRYVPKFLAISDIILNAEYYNLSFPQVSPSDELDLFFYTSEAPVVISTLRRTLEMDEALFSYLNPSLLLDISPPGFTFRLPVYYREMAAYAFETSQAAEAVAYKIKDGDTLWGISLRYGVTVESICAANKINEKAVLPIGKTLIVPIHK
ncbi:MAG: transglycosylase SLT domain-containing protein [Spirochaetaceae bacterium]|jgi:membrane-bound lytic murein transglycosylase D|nr:transglycosylase SLT domain-containing protein [Spirochaetaceae bacterium]